MLLDGNQSAKIPLCLYQINYWIFITNMATYISQSFSGKRNEYSPLEKGKATRSSIPAWRMLWTGEPGGLQSMGLQRVGHDWATHTHTCTHTESNIYFKELTLTIIGAGKFKILMEFQQARNSSGIWCCCLESQGSLNAEFLLFRRPSVFFCPCVFDLQCCVHHCCTQSDCANHTSIFKSYFPWWSIIGRHRTHHSIDCRLCAAQQGLAVYPVCVQNLTFANPSLPPHAPTTPVPQPPPACSLRLWCCSCFIDRFTCAILKIPHIRESILYVPLTFWRTSASVIISKCIPVAANGIISFVFIPLGLCTTSSLSILLTDV